MHRILVIAPQYIGDSVLAIPFLRELKKHCGRVEIDVISKNAGCFVFSKCPYVKKVYDIKKINYIELWKNKYTKAYVLKRSLSAALIALFSGAKERVGFGGQFREVFLTKVVNYDKNQNIHELEHFLNVLREDYIEITDKKLEFHLNPDIRDTVRGYLTSKKKALIVSSSSTYVKDWTNENFADVINYLDSQGYDIYFVGTLAEREFCEEIIELTENSIKKNLCGKLTLDEISALISEMDLVFGIDSGFCHMAAAMGRKVVTLFGPTSISQWAPIGSEVISLRLPCSPCKKPKKCVDNFACLKTLSSDMVIDELKKIL